MAKDNILNIGFSEGKNNKWLNDSDIGEHKNNIIPIFGAGNNGNEHSNGVDTDCGDELTDDEKVKAVDEFFHTILNGGDENGDIEAGYNVYYNRRGNMVVSYTNGVILEFVPDGDEMKLVPIYGPDDFGNLECIYSEDEDRNVYKDSIGYRIADGDFIFRNGVPKKVYEENGKLIVATTETERKKYGRSVIDLASYDGDIVLAISMCKTISDVGLYVITIADGRVFVYNSKTNQYFHVADSEHDD